MGEGIGLHCTVPYLALSPRGGGRGARRPGTTREMDGGWAVYVLSE